MYKSVSIILFAMTNEMETKIGYFLVGDLSAICSEIIIDYANFLFEKLHHHNQAKRTQKRISS